MQKSRLLFVSLLAVLGLLFTLPLQAQTAKDKIRLLIVDGQNNHGNWPQTTKMMKGYLEATGLFSVDIATTPASGKNMEGFKPEFSNYRVVLLNYNGNAWPSDTRSAFESFVKSGGGVLSVHAADNAFPEWLEFNKMIGLGGWGGRTEKDGPYVYYDQDGKLVRDDSPGRGGSHGAQHAFKVVTRNKKHPITKGLPLEWMHSNDELYDRLRGPAENMTVLATAYSAKDKGGTGRNEPMMMVIRYGKGRVFHTALGHGNDSQRCIGFITYLQRAAEWVATGKVKQKVPAGFPGPDEVSLRAE